MALEWPEGGLFCVGFEYRLRKINKVEATILAGGMGERIGHTMG
jgi:hypothetical protein